ncbi:MAG: mycofactocin biosynthesis peptidyl-dipeptidase MftE [Solirubrobacteraceae bacterium]
MNWVQVDDAPRRALIVPLGSLEQHGPHLPLDTDTRIAVAVAGATAARRPGVAVAPPIAFGSSGEHAAFPGTLSIGTAALAEVLVELGRDASRHWDSLLLVNGHGGNRDAVADAVARLTGEGRRSDAFSVAPHGADAHAGRSETSLLLHLDPVAVRDDQAEPGQTRPIAELMARLRSDGVRPVSPNGVLGDPTGATAGEGRRLLEELIAGCVARLDRLLSNVAAHA